MIIDSLTVRMTLYCKCESNLEDMHFAGVLEGTYQLVFFTPEMLLLKKKWRHILMNDRYSEGLKAFVIDEAHVVKKW